MKKLAIIISLGVAAGGLLLAGCSKSKNTATQSGSGADATMANGSSGGPVEMKINWVVGKAYPMHMEMEQSTKTDVPDQPQPVVQEVKLSQDFTISVVKALDNGGRELELKFENETMNVSQGDRNVLSFDSTQSPSQDADNPAAPVLRAMIGARIQYFTDANGKVERMEGVDALTQRIAATGNPQEQAMFKQMFSEDTLKRYVSFADALPNRAVNVSDSWPFQEDVPSTIGVLSLDMNYTFKNWGQYGNRQCAHIEATGNVSNKSISTETGAMVEIKKGEISGDFWFDPTLGMIVAVNNDQNMTLKISTRAQTMTAQFNQKVRLALVNTD